MTSKEALDILVGIAGYHAQYLDKEEIKEYNEALSHYEDITNGLEILEKLEAKTHLLFKEATAKEIIEMIDAMCVDEKADVIWQSGAYIRNKYIAQKIKERYGIKE